MFRFINSSLKQSVKAIPNTLGHSPSLHKKVSDDENDSKFPASLQIKYDQVLCIYKNVIDNPSYIHLESCNPLMDRKNIILELSLDPLKSWINKPNINYQHNCLNNPRGFGGNMTVYRLINNNTDVINTDVIKNKSKRKSLLSNKVKNESKKCINSVKILPLVNLGFKQSSNTFPNYVYNYLALFKEKDDNDNKLQINRTTKHCQSVCISKDFPNYSNWINLQSLYGLLDKKNLIPELPPDVLNLLNNKFVKNFPKVDNHFKWLFLNRLLTNLENQKCIDNNQSNLVDTKVNTKLLPSNEVKLEPKENTPKSAEVNIEKSCISEPLDNLKQLGHELNTKGCESAAQYDMHTALQYWNCAAIFNYPPSQFNLGAYYELNGDLIAAEKWYRSAVNSGDHPVAAFNLAILLNNKLNDIFKTEINDLFHISARQGCQEAQQCINEMGNSP